MRPAALKEILAYGGRLGITETVVPPGASGTVRQLLRYPGEIAGSGLRPLPDSLLILPPSGQGALAGGWDRAHPPCCLRNISCLALPEQKITASLRQFAQRTMTPLFSSCYDDSLLHSRLLGLLREKAERRIMVHGVLVRVRGLGVLLQGESGVGKTACGLALMGNGNHWVADDAVVLEGRGDAVYGRGHIRTAGRIAVRGRGILRASELLGEERLLAESRLDVSIRLLRSEKNAPAITEGARRDLLGVSLPCGDVTADANPRRTAERVMACLSRLAAGLPGFRTAAEELQRQPANGGANGPECQRRWPVVL